MTGETRPILPSGWRWSTIGEVALEIRNGISERPDEQGSVPVFRISAVRPMTLNLDDVRFLNGTSAQWKQYAVAPGDLLFTRYNGTRSLVGICAQVPEHSDFRVYPDKLIRVRVDPGKAVAAYVEKAVHVGTSRAAIDESLKTSAGQVGISGAQLKQVPLPLAPLDQQRRIVEKIESLTAKSRRAKEALDAIPPLLERFRQSVLAAAFRGDLTKDWREQHPDVEPADQLLARIRRERRKGWEQAELEKMRAKGKVPKDVGWKKKYVEPEPVDPEGLPEIPDTWCWTTADEVVEPGAEIVYGIVQPGPEVPGGVPYVRGLDIQQGQVLVGQLRRTSAEIAKRYERASLRGGDVLLGIIRATKVAIVPDSLNGTNITQGTARLRPSSIMTSEFLAGYLESDRTQRALHAMYRGIDMPGLNLRDVRRLPVLLAPMEEQQVIGTKLQAFQTRWMTLRAAARAAAETNSSLDNAVLAKAFRGEL